MDFEPGYIYHIYNRGNNNQKIFYQPKNYFFFLKKVKNSFLTYCNILAYCLMPNHFHLMIKVKEDYLSNELESSDKAFRNIEPLNRTIATLLSSYTKAINNQEGKTGSLFQQRTKAKCLTDHYYIDYPLFCFYYIHQNPVRAKLVHKIEDWQYSSFNEYLGKSNINICSIEIAYKLLDLPDEKDDFYKESYFDIPKHKLKGLL